MVEVYVERRGHHKPRRRWQLELIGKMPDQTGSYSLVDGTPVELDLSRVHPDWYQRWGRRESWTLTLKAGSTKEVGPKESPYIDRLSLGTAIPLSEDGVGKSPKLTGTRRLVVKLEKPIWRRDPASAVVVETNYPDYPELSKRLSSERK